MVGRAEEKRINQRLMQYWEQKRNGRLFPLEADIDPDEITDLWPNCFLVRVDDDHVDDIGSEFKYTYLGQSLIDAYGDDLGNKQVLEKLVYPSNLPLIKRFKEIVKTSQPETEESEFTNINNMLIKFRSCMMPLGRDEHHIGFIIGGMKWKAF